MAVGADMEAVVRTAVPADGMEEVAVGTMEAPVGKAAAGTVGVVGTAEVGMDGILDSTATGGVQAIRTTGPGIPIRMTTPTDTAIPTTHGPITTGTLTVATATMSHRSRHQTKTRPTFA